MLNTMDSMARVGLRRPVSSSDPSQGGGAVGSFTTHIGDVIGCTEPDALAKIRVISEYRIEEMKAQESSFAPVGAEVPQVSDFSVYLTQEEFTKNATPLLTFPERRAACQRPSPREAIELRQRKPGGLRWLAAVSRPDIGARCARLAPQVKLLQGSEVLSHQGSSENCAGVATGNDFKVCVLPPSWGAGA